MPMAGEDSVIPSPPLLMFQKETQIPETVSWDRDPITNKTSLREESREGKEG